MIYHASSLIHELALAVGDESLAVTVSGMLVVTKLIHPEGLRPERRAWNMLLHVTGYRVWSMPLPSMGHVDTITNHYKMKGPKRLTRER